MDEDWGYLHLRKPPHSYFYCHFTNPLQWPCESQPFSARSLQCPLRWGSDPGDARNVPHLFITCIRDGVYDVIQSCMYIYIYMFKKKIAITHTHTHLCIHTCIDIHIYIYTYIYIFTHIYIYIYIYLHTHIYIYTYTHTYIYTYDDTWIYWHK